MYQVRKSIGLLQKWMLVPVRKYSNSFSDNATGDQDAGKSLDILKLEAKFLLSAINDEEALIARQDLIINKDHVIRGFLEAELLYTKHKLHCRGVIERFINLKIPSLIGQHKFSSINTWTSIFTGDGVLLAHLSALKGFPNNIPESDKAVATSKLIQQFYKRLSDNIYNDQNTRETHFD